MKCRICGNEASNQAYEVPEMMFGLRDVFHYFQCSKCGCLQLSGMVSDLQKYYPSDYYSHGPILPVSRWEAFLKRTRNAYALFGASIPGQVLSWIYPQKDLSYLRRLSLDRQMRILDVGCGAGPLLYSMRELGMRNLLGIDPFNQAYIRYDNGLEILKKSLEDVCGQWDLVMFNHSLEHIPDHVQALESVRRLLARNGQCVVRIPTVSSYAWQHYGTNWVQLDAPRHFFLHSVESMTMLARQAGFELCDIFYDSSAFQFWGSEQYARGIPLRSKLSYAENPRGSIFSRKDMRTFEKRAKELNVEGQGDQAAFWFRKL